MNVAWRHGNGCLKNHLPFAACLFLFCGKVALAHKQQGTENCPAIDGYSEEVGQQQQQQQLQWHGFTPQGIQVRLFAPGFEAVATRSHSILPSRPGRPVGCFRRVSFSVPVCLCMLVWCLHVCGVGTLQV